MCKQMQLYSTIPDIHSRLENPLYISIIINHGLKIGNTWHVWSSLWSSNTLNKSSRTSKNWGFHGKIHRSGGSPRPCHSQYIPVTPRSCRSSHGRAHKMELLLDPGGFMFDPHEQNSWKILLVIGPSGFLMFFWGKKKQLASLFVFGFNYIALRLQIRPGTRINTYTLW